MPPLNENPDKANSQQFIDFLQGLQKMKDSFLKNCNTQLATLPPIEQHEATTVVGSAVRQLNSAFAWIAAEMQNMDRQIIDIINAVPVVIANETGAYLKKQIEAGDILSKDTALAQQTDAINVAVKAREDAVRLEFTTVLSRKAELVTAKSATEPAILSREVADKLPIEFLMADDYMAKAHKLASRLKDVSELGVEVPQLLSQATEFPLDEAGDKRFGDQLSMLRSVAGTVPKPAGAPNPLAQNSNTENAGSDLVGLV